MNGGLTTAIKALFVCAALIAAGWVIDDRINKQTERLTTEVHRLRVDIRDISVKVGRIEGQMQAQAAKDLTNRQ